MSNYEELDAIRVAKESWERENAQQFENERKKHFESEDGTRYKRIYTPLDLEEKDFSYMQDLGLPGTYPYTRGCTCSGHRAQLFERYRVLSHGLPEENNKLWKTLLVGRGGGGERYLTVVYDLPCLWGYDPDDPMSEGQVGTVGGSFASLRDWEIALDGIDINMLLIHQAVDSIPSVALAYHAAMQQLRGLDISQMLGVIQNDFTKEYAGGYPIFPIEHAMRQSLDVICWCHEHAPYYGTLMIRGDHHKESGLSAVQTTAVVMAAAIFYLEAARERGVDVDSLVPKMCGIYMGTHATFWENICIQRARRRIWAKLLRDRFGAKRPESLQWRMDGAGSGGSLAYKQEYLNNITRTTLGALSSILGGGPPGIVPPDEALGVPDTESCYFVVQTQRVIQYETDICDVVDPLGGSYFIESLTSELEEKVWKEIDTIEKRGGILRCLETGYLEQMRAEAAYKWQAAFDRGEIVRVGVNRFVSPEAQQGNPVYRPYRANPESERQRVAAVQELRRKRDNEKVKKALSDVKVVAAAEPTPENNIMPPIIEAVKCYATIGEITGALKEVWGEYKGAGTRV